MEALDLEFTENTLHNQARMMFLIETAPVFVGKDLSSPGGTQMVYMLQMFPTIKTNPGCISFARSLTT
jgi:hypothetical protein